MALIWDGHRGETHYEVRNAGRSIRLYTDGILHTQFHPDHLWTGSVWDLLALAAFAHQELPRRILVLGVGGGAVLRQLQSLCAPTALTGVDLDAMHLRIARRWFGVRGAGVELVHADAVTFAALYDGEPFDLVIDDLFCGSNGVPQRAVPVDAHWLDMLLALVAPDGVLAINFPDARALRASAWTQAGKSLRRRFPGALSLAVPGCHNRVLLLAPQAIVPRGLLERAAGTRGSRRLRASARIIGKS